MWLSCCRLISVFKRLSLWLTGQGTGLGLSMSYDIVKAHGGEIKVETHPGEGTIFIIQLPVARIIFQAGVGNYLFMN
jgi:signal transduction histidine kinase